MLPATSLPTRALAAGAAAVTADIGREEARGAARQELAKAAYHRDDPSLLAQLLLRAAEQIGRLLQRASAAAPGGWGGLVAVAAALLLIVVAIRLRVGPVGRSRARPEPVLAERATTADEHRERAEHHTAREQWGEALRERLRALARALEERGILETRPGRTADELAGQAAAALPAQAGELHAAARLFDDVCYGGRAAGPEAYARVRELDERVRTTRPELAGGPQ